MKKLISILLAAVMFVTCGGIDCSAARAKLFSRMTHSRPRSSFSRGSRSRFRSSSWFGPRKRSIWSSNGSSSGSSCGSCASSKSDVIVVNNNVEQNNGADKEKEVIIIEDGKDNSAKAVVIKEQKETNNDGILEGTVALLGGVVVVGAIGYSVGYDEGLGTYYQRNKDHKNCVHSWGNLRQDVLEYLTPEKYKSMKEDVVKKIYDKFKDFDKKCVTEQ